MIILIIVAFSVIVGYLCGGRLSGLLKTQIKGLWMPIVAFALDFGLEFLVSAFPVLAGWGWAFISAQYAILIVFVVINLFDPAFCLFGLGTVANFLVIALNSFRMPVDRRCFDVNDAVMRELSAQLARGEIYGYTLADANTKLAPLGDVILIPVLNGFASVGDLLLFAGIAYMIIRGMHRYREDKNARTAFSRVRYKAD